jgi:CRP/FNR family transcriptional regulator, cyclic AMP receptor protein
METSHTMPPEDVPPLYQIWGADQTAYGPVELPAVVNWIKEERVLADTWLYLHETKQWLQAAQVPELKMFFQPKSKAVTVASDDGNFDDDLKITPGALRRIKIFAEFDNDQLLRFVKFMEITKHRPATLVVRKGDPGEAMYLVLEGELRSCLMSDTIETPIATLPLGSIFGEISLLDQGPHAVDVITNQESALLRISSEGFQRLVKEAPSLALPFILGLCKAIAGRVRTLTKRYEDSSHLSHTAEAILS